jgi:UDP-glucuronate 4-epimerase
MSQRILVTGGAGFIGSTLVESLLKSNNEITVIDNFDNFYPRQIKEKNIEGFINNPKINFIELDILNDDYLRNALGKLIVHLAAKAGVRPSIEDPLGYQDANVKGTQNLLEFAKKKKIMQFVFASSSSVYGINENTPWSEDDYVLKPISPYASTKVSGELLGHVYSHLFGIRFLALRFFTVYGPRQRPDLAIHKFSAAILAGEPITMFGNGGTKRDYTYVDDIVSGITAAIDYNKTMYEVVNLGNSHTVSLSEMISVIEDVFKKKANIIKAPEQPGDVPITYADTAKAKRLFNYEAKTSFREGVIKFKNWINNK